MSDNVKAHLMISGLVQGVGFRYFTSRLANQYGLAGWVRNTPDGNVEVEVEGDRGLVMAFIKEVQTGPSSGHVAAMDVQWQKYAGKYKDFRVMF